MIRAILILALTITAIGVSAQPFLHEQPVSDGSDRRVYSTIQTHVGDSYANTWNVGSAKKLSGKIYVLEIWLTRPGTAWNKTDMGNVQYKINNALAWLQRMAARYSVKVEFEKGSYHGDGGGVAVANLPRSYEDCANQPLLLTRALKVIGYDDVIQCYNSLKEFSGIDNIIVLIIINNDGWSNANQFSTLHATNHFRDYFLESVNLFRTDDGEPTSGATIAHEILHLFGAWDMYGGQASNAAGKWANQNYPNEIMLQVSSPLDNLTISPLTAWLVGLTTEYHDWYWNFVREEYK
ncbi:MAG: hypothetical protein J5595_06360 [Bacteroidales bacterium]|nr:hypothetical protein [Bacteroidales bacterium]